MKKTIIAMLALSGVAFGATTIDSQWITAPTTGGNFFNNGWSMTFTLDESYTIADSGSILGAFWGDSGTGNYGANAIYLTGGTDGSFTLNVGRGKLSSTTIDHSTTFTAGGDSKTDYTTWSGSIQTGVTYQLVATGINGMVGVTVAINDVPVDGTWSLDTYKTNMNGGGADTTMKYGLNSGVAISTPAVPEPTTATLSLLALAGLAARRRRK